MSIEKLKNKKGFTLVEMMVSVALFAIVMTVATGAIFSVVSANRKAQALNSVISNLNFTIESMLREMRTGTNYNCGSYNPPITTASDCPTSDGSTFMSLVNSDGNDVEYEFNAVNNNIIKRQTDSAGTNETSFPITAPEVTVNSLKFYVVGTDPSLHTQPRILVRVSGTAGVNNYKSDFDIQTTVSQRAPNVQ